MPTHIRASCSWQLGSMLPRDAVQITPCFRHQRIDPLQGTDWTQLATDLANGLNTWRTQPANQQLTVRLYEIGLPPINRPKATVVLNPAQSVESSVPREVALCLSFFGGNNEPHNRGRLYIPPTLFTGGVPTVRPTQAMRDKVGELAGIFAGLGGVDVDWIVWSKTRAAATKVTNWYVDDEWDTQRRRGLKPTTRSSGTTGG